jgi:CDP-diglyceride synthetase
VTAASPAAAIAYAPHAAALPHGLSALVLLTAANAAPWAAARLLGTRFAAPIDAGMTFIDGRPLLGGHKTWRGLAAALLVAALVAPILGYSVRLGLAFAALGAAGDLASSLIKRRMRLAPGTEIPGLDQIPEALTPMLCLSAPLGLNMGSAWTLTAVFLLLDIAAIPLRRLRRDQHVR